MKTIIFGFSVPINPTLFAKAIMWADKTPYDHVYVKWSWTAIQRDVYYQASKLAVNFESCATFLGHAKVVEEYEIQVSDECFKTIMQFCIDNSNIPYGILEILGFAYVKLAKMVGQTVHNPFPTHGRSFVCSKLAGEIFAMANPGAVSASFDDIDPLDFHNILADAVSKNLVKRIA